MADQQVQKDGTFDLIPVIALVAPRARVAVEYFIKNFGAKLLKHRSVKKRKAGQDKALLQVLLQFGSGKVLVVDRLEEDFENHPNCEFQMVYKGNPKPAVWTVEKMGGGGDTIVKERVDVMEDLAFEDSTKKDLNTIVQDPFGIDWTIAGKKITIPPYLGTSSDTASGAAAGSEDTTAGTSASKTRADDDATATKNGSNDDTPDTPPADTTESIDTTQGLMID